MRYHPARALRGYALRRRVERLREMIRSHALDRFIEFLLHAMRFNCFVNEDYRRNIEKPFRARYAFQSENGRIAASAEFKKGRMKVYGHRIDNTDITVTFKDSGVLMDFLFDKEPDVLRALLRQDFRTEGNLNYLFKFVFMARRIREQFAL